MDNNIQVTIKEKDTGELQMKLREDLHVGVGSHMDRKEVLINIKS